MTELKKCKDQANEVSNGYSCKVEKINMDSVKYDYNYGRCKSNKCLRIKYGPNSSPTTSWGPCHWDPDTEYVFCDSALE